MKNPEEEKEERRDGYERARKRGGEEVRRGESESRARLATGVDGSYEPEGLSMVADSTSEPEAGCGGRRRGFKWKLRPIRRNRHHGYRRLRPPGCIQTFRATNVPAPYTFTRPLYAFKYIARVRVSVRLWNVQIPLIQPGDSYMYPPLGVYVRLYRRPLIYPLCTRNCRCPCVIWISGPVCLYAWAGR